MAIECTDIVIAAQPAFPVVLSSLISNPISCVRKTRLSVIDSPKLEVIVLVITYTSKKIGAKLTLASLTRND